MAWDGKRAASAACAGVAAGALAIALAAPPASRAEPASASASAPDGYLYVINAGKTPAEFKLDQAETARLPAFSHLTEPVAPGAHGLAAMVGPRVVSQYQELDLADAGRDARGRAFWCVMVSGTGKGVPRLTMASAAECLALVGAGEDAPIPPGLHAAVAR